MVELYMDQEIKDVLLSFKQHTSSNPACDTYEDQILDYEDVAAVNQRIPYILRDVIMEPGDHVHELAPMQQGQPFYAWFRNNQHDRSVGIFTVAGSAPGTTAICFKLIAVDSQEQLLSYLATLFFTQTLQ